MKPFDLGSPPPTGDLDEPADEQAAVQPLDSEDDTWASEYADDEPAPAAASEEPPEEAPEPESAAAPAPDDLARRLAELERRGSGVDEERLAGAIARALQPRSGPEPQRLPNRPQISEDALADPREFERAITQQMEWASQVTLAQVAPHLQAMQHELSLVRGAAPLIRQQARSVAAERLVSAGVATSPEEAGRLLDDAVTHVVNTDPQRDMHLMSPDSLYMAALYRRGAVGDPVQRRDQPPPGNSGDPSATRATAQTKREAQALAWASRALGVEFDKSDAARLRQIREERSL